MDQQDFIEQINRKSPRAFHDFFKSHYKTLVHFTMQYVKTLEDAEDIMQNVFIRLWENDIQYESYNSLQTYLYTSARNAALDFLKHKEVEKRHADYASLQDATDADLHLKMLQRRKEIFKLYIGGKRNEEIARLLGVSVETVKTAKKESVRYIRERMGKWFVLLCLLDGGNIFGNW